MLDGRSIVAAIPMRDHVELTEAVVESIADDADSIIIFDNGSRNPTSMRWFRSAPRRHPQLEVRHRPGNGIIYRLWNEAWKTAIKMGLDGTMVDLAILNNDIVCPPQMLRHLSYALRAAPDHIWITYPDYRRPLSAGVDVTSVTETGGTFNLGGMSGFCFMLKPEYHVTHGWPFIDESFEWHCGDGDLVEQMQLLGGRAGRVDGLPLEHRPQTTARDGRNAWTEAAKRRDRERRRLKYG